MRKNYWAKIMIMIMRSRKECQEVKWRSRDERMLGDERGSKDERISRDERESTEKRRSRSKRGSRNERMPMKERGSRNERMSFEERVKGWKNLKE